LFAAALGASAGHAGAAASAAAAVAGGAGAAAGAGHAHGSTTAGHRHAAIGPALQRAVAGGIRVTRAALVPRRTGGGGFRAAASEAPGDHAAPQTEDHHPQPGSDCHLGP